MDYKRVLALCKKYHVTQQTLAETTGYSKGYVNKFLTGRYHGCSEKFLFALSSALVMHIKQQMRKAKELVEEGMEDMRELEQ